MATVRMAQLRMARFRIFRPAHITRSHGLTGLTSLRNHGLLQVTFSLDRKWGGKLLTQSELFFFEDRKYLNFDDRDPDPTCNPTPPHTPTVSPDQSVRSPPTQMPPGNTNANPNIAPASVSDRVSATTSTLFRTSKEEIGQSDK